MELFFEDPDEIRLPPEEVRVRELRAAPWEDGRKVKVTLEVDAFQKRPNVELTIFTPEGEAAANTSVIGSMSRRMELNMHLRGEVVAGEYAVEAEIFYSSNPTDGEAGNEQPALEKKVVDKRRQTFTIH